MFERVKLEEQERRFVKAMHPHLEMRWEVKADLKPCPFCGYAPKLYGGFAPYGDDEANAYMIECAECNISWAQLWEYDEIVNKWNYRADTQETHKD